QRRGRQHIPPTRVRGDLRAPATPLRPPPHRRSVRTPRHWSAAVRRLPWRALTHAVASGCVARSFRPPTRHLRGVAPTTTAEVVKGPRPKGGDSPSRFFITCGGESWPASGVSCARPSACLCPCVAAPSVTSRFVISGEQVRSDGAGLTAPAE